MRERRRLQSRPGFTVVEVLVVLTVLAILAALVVPDIGNRVGEGDSVRVASDLNSITGGLEIFRLDLKQIFPEDIEDMVHRVDSTTDRTIDDLPYRTPHVQRWNGPYLKASIPEEDGKSTREAFNTGYRGTILDSLTLYDAETNDETIDACGDERWVSVVVLGLAEPDFEATNDVIDGDTETDGDAPDGSQNQGRLRYHADDGVTYHLAHPCRGD